jgi:hypothetical protein
LTADKEGRGSLPRSRRWLFGAALILSAGFCACDGDFRFDNHPDDAGASSDLPVNGDALAGEGLPAATDGGSDGASLCSDSSCRFQPTDCPGSMCRLLCPSETRCDDTCGASCAADCEQTSTCQLSAGPSAQIKCEQDSACVFTVGDSALVECWSRSHCDVHCTGACIVECTDSATCRLSCGDETLRPVTGRPKCP